MEELRDWWQEVGAPVNDDSLAVIAPDSFGWRTQIQRQDSIAEGLGYSLRNVQRFTENTQASQSMKTIRSLPMNTWPQ